MANPILDRAKAHFSSLSRPAIEVPEWGDDSGPLKIYHTPLTLKEKQLIRNRRDSEGVMAAMAQTLIIKAKDALGNPLFTIEDKQGLMTGVDSDVVERVAAEIVNGASVEEQEKNLVPAPT